jgi:hypothetical protein
MSEVEQRIAAMNRERAGHLWSAAVRLQREVLELRGEMAGVRELNAELLFCLNQWRENVRQGYVIGPSLIRLADEVIAKAEKLK